MMEVPTTSNEYFDEAITTIELPGQTSTRENYIKKSEKSDSETLSYGSRSSKSQQSYAQYLEYFARYASTYALYDRSHYPKPCFKSKRIIVFVIFCFVFGFVGLGVGLNATLSKSNPEPNANETTTSPNRVSTTEANSSTTEDPPTVNPRWFKPESVVAFLGVFSSRLIRTFNSWLRRGGDPSPFPTTTPNTTVNGRPMERLEITSDHNTAWNSWSNCNPINNCSAADPSGEICSIRTRLGSVWIDGNQIEVKQESPDECECVPCPTWGSWTECSPAHNCLDTITSGQTCPIRTRSGRIWTNGDVIDTINETTTEGCNCEPCTFSLTDWVGGDCTRDAGINGGDGDCPCHWTEYRYCQQLSHGTLKSFWLRIYFLFLDGSVMKTFDPRVDYGHNFLFACEPPGMDTRKNFWSPKCGWGCGQG